MEYHKKLASEGMNKERALETAISLSSLYEALNRLDDKNLKLFMSKSIEERLSEFATTEGGMRDFTGLSMATASTK